MSNRRKIHLDQVWEYIISRGNVIIFPPNNGTKKVIRVHDFLGWDSYQFEKACYKGSRPPITPSDIKIYIEENLIKELP